MVLILGGVFTGGELGVAGLNDKLIIRESIIFIGELDLSFFISLVI